jgi:hypothetical protein
MNDFDGLIAVCTWLVVGFAALYGLSYALTLTPYILMAAIPAGVGYAGFVFWRDNPSRKENVAAAHLGLAYEKTLAGTVGGLGDDVIERLLAYEVPGTLLGTDVERELVHIGKGIIKQLDVSSTVPKPPAVADSIEGARYLDRLAKISTRSPERVRELVEHIAAAIGMVVQYTPNAGPSRVPISSFIPNLPALIEELTLHFFDDEAFGDLQRTLEENVEKQKGVLPTKYKGDDVVDAYLSGTPLEALFSLSVPFGVPQELRFSHTHIMGMPGSGKTHLLKSMIFEDIKIGNTVIVIDGQEDLIREITAIAPKDRLVVVDPNDVEYPVALNMFDIGQERFADYSPQMRMQAKASVENLFSFVFSSFMDEMTEKQSSLFVYLTQLLLSVPGANFLTMAEVCRPGGLTDYLSYVEKLDEPARVFFSNDFNTEYKTTKGEVSRRIMGLLNNQVLAQMFLAEKSKFKMHEEMAKPGRIICVNTAKSLLGQRGHKLFGRLFIAMALQSMQERALDTNRQPTFLYIDEAYEYLDENVKDLLTTARKYCVGLVLAHQYMGQLSRSLQSALAGTTAIKIMGVASVEDVPVVARFLDTSTEAVRGIKRRNFLARFDGIGTLPWQAAPIDGSEFRPTSSREMEAFRAELHELYCRDLTSAGVAPPATTPPSPVDDSPELY